MRETAALVFSLLVATGCARAERLPADQRGVVTLDTRVDEELVFKAAS